MNEVDPVNYPGERSIGSKVRERVAADALRREPVHDADVARLERVRERGGGGQDAQDATDVRSVAFGHALGDFDPVLCERRERFVVRLLRAQHQPDAAPRQRARASSRGVPSPPRQPRLGTRPRLEFIAEVVERRRARRGSIHDDDAAPLVDARDGPTVTTVTTHLTTHQHPLHDARVRRVVVPRREHEGGIRRERAKRLMDESRVIVASVVVVVVVVECPVVVRLGRGAQGVGDEGRDDGCESRARFARRFGAGYDRPGDGPRRRSKGVVAMPPSRATVVVDRPGIAASPPRPSAVAGRGNHDGDARQRLEEHRGGGAAREADERVHQPRAPLARDGPVGRAIAARLRRASQARGDRADHGARTVAALVRVLSHDASDQGGRGMRRARRLERVRPAPSLPIQPRVVVVLVGISRTVRTLHRRLQRRRDLGDAPEVQAIAPRRGPHPTPPAEFPPPRFLLRARVP